MLEGLVDSEKLRYRSSYKLILENLDYNSLSYKIMMNNLLGGAKDDNKNEDNGRRWFVSGRLRWFKLF